MSGQLQRRVHAAPKHRSRVLTTQVLSSKSVQRDDSMEVDEVRIEAGGEVVKISPRRAGSPRSAKIAVKRNPDTGQLEEVAAEVQWYKCRFEGCEGTEEGPCGHRNGYCGPCATKLEEERQWFQQQENGPWPRAESEK